jgi:Calcineurin-like phosphoesterase
MTWAGTGVLWTISGGVPRSLGIIDEALAAGPSKLTFVQISDSHIGFHQPANPNATGTLQEGIAKIKSLPVRPAFMIHTGDISHLSKAAEFDDADQAISQSGLDVHYVPGEHDFLDEGVKLYRDRYGKNTKGTGWYSFDADGVHFIGLVNVANLKAGGLGNLGEEQLKWLADDVRGKSAETPIVVLAHICRSIGAIRRHDSFAFSRISIAIAVIGAATVPARPSVRYSRRPWLDRPGKGENPWSPRR